MELAWMGRYRRIIGVLMANCNMYSRVATKKNKYEYNIELSALEWQVLEAVFEHEDQICNMACLAGKLGIAQSNFSKYVKTLCELNLVERFYRTENKKDIVLRLSDLGRKFYYARSAELSKAFETAFSLLEDVSDEHLEQFSTFLELITHTYLPYIDKSYGKNEELMKID